MKKRRLIVAPAIVAAALAGGSIAAQAQTPPQQPQQQQPAQPDSGADAQDPSYTGTVPVPQTPDNGTEAKDNESQESAALAGLAKVTADEARAAALAQFPGATVKKVSLDDENGWLVWSVDLLDGTTSRDVKVDAGSGTILHVDSGDGAESEGGSEADSGAED